MSPETRTIARGLTALISAGLLLTILWFGGGVIGFVIVIGTDHSESVLDEWGPQLITGALLGALTALLAGRYDRRYWLWTGPLALVGMFATGFEDLYFGAFPAVASGPLLAALLVLQAWLGRDNAPSRITAIHLWTGAIATLMTTLIVGATAVFIYVGSQPTSAYEVMQADPMADHLPGMTLEHDSSNDRSRVFDTPAEVSRVWTITDGSPRPEKLTELRALAVRHGWVASTDPYCGCQKITDGHQFCLEIRKSFKPTFVEVDIRLRSD